MQRFDSAKVAVQLRPSDVERLLDIHFRTLRHSDYDAAVDLALAYSDHSRACTLAARGVDAVVAWFLPMFAQVTDIEPLDALWNTEDSTRELERRFAVCIISLERVTW